MRTPCCEECAKATGRSGSSGCRRSASTTRSPWWQRAKRQGARGRCRTPRSVPAPGESASGTNFCRGPTDSTVWCALTTFALPGSLRHGSEPGVYGSRKRAGGDGCGERDGWTARHTGLVVLADDKKYFPPYYCAVVVRKQSLEQHPGLEAALKSLVREDRRRRNAPHERGGRSRA